MKKLTDLTQEEITTIRNAYDDCMNQDYTESHGGKHMILMHTLTKITGYNPATKWQAIGYAEQLLEFYKKETDDEIVERLLNE